jgi:hypothetical protein
VVVDLMPFVAVPLFINDATTASPPGAWDRETSDVLITRR